MAVCTVMHIAHEVPRVVNFQWGKSVLFFGGAILTILHFMTFSKRPLRTGSDWLKAVDAQVAQH